MEIGSKTWTRGEEITITTKPYELYGKMWQDGIDANGKTWTVATEVQRQVIIDQNKANWEEQQAGFARLKKLQK